MSESANGVLERPATKGRALRLFICQIDNGSEPAIQVGVAAMDFCGALKTLDEALPGKVVLGCAPSNPVIPVFVSNREL